jgi:hypothetical protein
MQESVAEAMDAKSINRMQACGTLLINTVDMPFSALGDTLTLPFTISEAIKRRRHPEQYHDDPLQLAPSGPDRPSSP